MTILIDYGRAGMQEKDSDRDDGEAGAWLSPAEAAFRKRVMDLIARIEEKVDRMLDERGERGD